MMGCTDQDVAGEYWRPMTRVTRLKDSGPKVETIRMPQITPKSIGYKIRRRSDGKFSTGGSHPTFSSRVGKTWGSLGDLHGHFACIREYASWNLRQNRVKYYGDPVAHCYDGCDLVTLIESETTPIERHFWR